MFELCKKVTIYHIQNHYHYHNNNNDQQTLKFRRKQWNQLKVSPIKLIDSKKSTQKGISLSVNTHNKPKPGKQQKTIRSHKITLTTNNKLIDNHEFKNGQKKLTTFKTNFSENTTNKEFGKDYLKYLLQNKRQNLSMKRMQNLNTKSKPILHEISLKKDQSDLNSIPLKKISSNLAQTNITSNLKNKSAIEIEEKILSISGTPQNESIYSIDHQTQSKKSQENPHFLQRENPVQVSSHSLHEQRSHLLTIPSITEPSIILSQILYANEYNEPGGQKNSLKLWPTDNDRHTIKSINESQQKSIRIEESIIFQHQSKHNFYNMVSETLSKQNYSLKLAVEKDVLCLVSIKEIPFKHMSNIALQVQIYEMVKAELGGQSVYRNILQLYQTQMHQGSYLLIKEPYCRILNYNNIEEEQIQQILSTVMTILIRFERINVHACRFIKLEDIVESMGVYKIHDLSAFKTGKQVYKVQQIMECLRSDIRIKK